MFYCFYLISPLLIFIISVYKFLMLQIINYSIFKFNFCFTEFLFIFVFLIISFILFQVQSFIPSLLAVALLLNMNSTDAVEPDSHMSIGQMISALLGLNETDLLNAIDESDRRVSIISTISDFDILEYQFSDSEEMIEDKINQEENVKSTGEEEILLSRIMKATKFSSSLMASFIYNQMHNTLMFQIHNQLNVRTSKIRLKNQFNLRMITTKITIVKI